MALFVFGFTSIYENWPPRVFARWSTAFAAGSAVILVCALDSGSWIARALSMRPLVALGRISYSLYLGLQNGFDTALLLLPP